MNSRVLRAVAPFGVAPDDLIPAADDDAEADACRLLDALDETHSPGRVALITGPSGSGKSRLLSTVRKRLGASGANFTDTARCRPDPARALAAQRASMPVEAWLGLLSMAGLADARLLPVPAGMLSEGERARLRLALAMARARRGGFLLIDECCSTLDRCTAVGVAATIRRWATRSGVCVIAAGAHEDLARLLGPDLVVRCEPGVPRRFERGPGVARAGRIRVEGGTAADYAALARYHYRPGRPASPSRILRAVAAGGRLAGVLVVSFPTLNGSWRGLIWPGRYRGDDKRAIARRLNRELRRISRVIVDPRDRGRGIARRLVRAYLDHPDTPATEAVAAMGRLSPFGASAGMTAYPVPPRPADDRLGDMLDAAGVEPWEMLDPARVEQMRGDGLLRRELGVWARAVYASIPKPRRGCTDVFDLAPLAAARLCAPPVAYGCVAE
ncbi:MAG TPA: hypothetical protein ENK11_09620 [Phycisphaerales bacterium]|nr:hypothetical protein [Phycisphaerales bacterium]